MRKAFIIENEDPQNLIKTKIEWIGPKRPNSKYTGYMRLESNGNYLGVVNLRQLRQLKSWLDALFLEKI